MNQHSLSNDPAAVIAADRAHVWHHLIQHKPFETIDPRIIVEGRGLRVWDIKGREHIDAVSGAVWTVNVGYGRKRIADAVAAQLTKMCFFAGASGTIPGAQFAEMLVDKMPGLDRVYYANSGSEANEKAFKMVRQIAHKHHAGRKHKILFRERDYHGTTITNLSAGGQHERNAQYGPYTPGFVQVPHCLEYRRQDGLTDDDYGVRAADAI
ncbi:MAG: aminotransferase class III-fold pyridoxal phosphate-dependent enzyme, partial [Alphaproteobacteria bacterium]|nr:aminotransferase class III-fold pyridoxal phosphate-dependent enzyme [Alphaproteobacteria bacterium]